MESKGAEKLAEMNGGAQCGTAAREKRWDELGIEEKVERLRQVAMRTDERVDTTAQLAVEAHELVHEHNHDQLGRVVKLAKETANRLMRGLAGARRYNPLA
jgi:hypothetical protein